MGFSLFKGPEGSESTLEMVGVESANEPRWKGAILVSFARGTWLGQGKKGPNAINNQRGLSKLAVGNPIRQVQKGPTHGAFQTTSNKDVAMLSETPATIQQKCEEINNLLKDHDSAANKLFEALSKRTGIEEAETHANDLMEHLMELAVQVIAESSPSDQRIIRQTLETMSSHCESWDVVNNENQNPALDLFEKLKGNYAI